MSNLLKFFSEHELKKIKESDYYTKAELLVKRLFKDKKDKGGNAYLDHLYYVSKHLEEINMKTVGLLHDILEDTSITSKDLKVLGFSDEIINTLEIITKDTNEVYDDYINRILESNNLVAINVKAIDMQNNLDLTRIKNPTKKDIDRCQKKYKPQYEKIINYLKEQENEYDRY